MIMIIINTLVQISGGRKQIQIPIEDGIFFIFIY